LVGLWKGVLISHVTQYFAINDTDRG